MAYNIKFSAQYISGCTEVAKCPTPKLPEYAFTGRSNVGKSSLINALTNISKLAKISSTPGKTQIINHFLIDNCWFLADLPGYGYARIAKTSRQKWNLMLKEYVCKRKNLMTVFVLVDSRLEPQKSDIEFINWLGENQIPIAIIFTKADKCSKNELSRNTKNFCTKLSEYWEELPKHFITSSISKHGIKELVAHINELNQLF